jgi:hypothetical protein
MSGWIAPVVAAIISRRKADYPLSERSRQVKVLYTKCIKTPAAVHYSSDFNVVTTSDGSFEVIPKKEELPPSVIRYALARKFDSIDVAKPFILCGNMVLRATSFQERNLEGEWDGYWQEFTLSDYGTRLVEQAERSLKDAQ